MRDDTVAALRAENHRNRSRGGGDAGEVRAANGFGAWRRRGHLADMELFLVVLLVTWF